jgi:ubiquinone/menaquinone biosynthesis C-methylase UbiE
MGEDGRFDDFARSYDAAVQDAIGASGETVQFFAELKVHLMARALSQKRPATILDFGCGIGNTTRAIAARFDDSHVIGFDTSSESIAVAHEMSSAQSARMEYISSSERRLPLDDASMGAAFTSCVFHHIDTADRAHWMRELRRVLAPGASLFVFEHNPYNPLTVRVVRRVPFDEGVVLLRPRDTIRLMREAGFATSRASFYFFFPAFLRALRPLEHVMHRIPLGAQYFVAGIARA